MSLKWVDTQTQISHICAMKYFFLLQLDYKVAGVSHNT